MRRRVINPLEPLSVLILLLGPLARGGNTLYIHCLDVGDGDATLFVSPQPADSKFGLYRNHLLPCRSNRRSYRGIGNWLNWNRL